MLTLKLSEILVNIKVNLENFYDLDQKCFRAMLSLGSNWGYNSDKGDGGGR